MKIKRNSHAGVWLFWGEEYDFADARLSKRYSNADVSILVAADRKVFIVRLAHEGTILLREITDVNEGDAICRI